MELVVLWATVLVYLLAMIAISAWAKRYVKSTDDFLLAGRRLGVLLATATLAATHYGGGFVLGGASWGVRYGIGGLWYGFSCGLGLALLGITFARMSRLLALYTVPEILQLRYRWYPVQALSALLSLLAMIGIVGAQVWAAGAIFEAMGLPGLLGAILATIVFIVYTALSGLWAVTLTDIVQLIIGTLGVLAGCVLAVSAAGGLSGIEKKLSELYALGVITRPPSDYFNLMAPGVSLIILTLAATVMYTLIGQDFYQRLFAAKDDKTAVKSAVFSGLLLMIVSVMPPLVGLASLAISPEPEKLIASPRTAVPHLLLVVFGPVLGAVFLATVLAAVMSTADSLLLAATSHIIRDFYVRYNPKASDKELLRLSVVVTVVAGFFALAAALAVKGIIELLIYSYDLYTSGVFIPLVLGVTWKRATKEGALAGMIAGFIASLMGILGVIPAEIYELIYVWGAFTSLIVTVLVSLVTKPTLPEEKFAKTLGWMPA